MTRVRQLLDEEIGPLPPSTIDLDAIIATQRRRHRYRQAGLGLSAGVVALAAVLIASTLTDWGERSAPSGGRLTSVHSASAPDASSAAEARAAELAARRAAAERAATERAAQRAVEMQHLSNVLLGLLHRALPGARFESSPVAPSKLVLAGGPLDFVDAGTYFEAGAMITDAAGVGNITVKVGKPDDVLRRERGCPRDPAPKDLHVTCTIKRPGGGALLQIVRTSKGKYQSDAVEILRPDGNVVSVELMNTVHPFKAERDGLNFTVGQLEALVTNPKLATHL